MVFSVPSLEYGALAPMLVIFIAGVIAVIVEAFASSKLRAPLQLAISLGAVVLSFAQVLRLRGTTTATAAVNSVVIDGPVLFMQGTILVLALFAFLLIADIDSFAAQASAIPGSQEERTLLSFLKSFRYIVETAQGLDQKLSELKELSTSTPGNRHWWARYSEGDPLWPDSYFIGQLWIRLPKGVGHSRAEKLYLAGFRTIEEILTASDGDLLRIKGIGKKAISKIHAECHL
ncbi:MAG: hypothetical protein EBX92_09705 [Actinobacteria bacterium]|nr:hypothetical protein [Actinomycetota bacterium]